MWSPVFEIICGLDGSTEFFLHGRDKKDDCLYPGFVTGIEKSCNVLLLEVEPRREKKLCGGSEREAQFCNLDFCSRGKLLDIVTGHVGIHVLETLSGKLFPCSKDDNVMLLERSIRLLEIHKRCGNWKHMTLEDNELCSYPIGGSSSSSYKTFWSSDTRHLNLQSFLSSGDTLCLSLKASKTELPSRLGWPAMPVNCFSLYKLPILNPVDNQEYAGLWGGTFGWPPGKCTEDKPGSLFVISDDLMAFVWQETKTVFTFQRLNLEEILKKGLGLRVPPLPPTMNFTYPTNSYINVITESSTYSSSSDSE